MAGLSAARGQIMKVRSGGGPRWVGGRLVAAVRSFRAIAPGRRYEIRTCGQAKTLLTIDRPNQLANLIADFAHASAIGRAA